MHLPLRYGAEFLLWEIIGHIYIENHHNES